MEPYLKKEMSREQQTIKKNRAQHIRTLNIGGVALLKICMTKHDSALTTVDLVRVVLAVRLTITKHRDRDALFTVLACKLTWLTPLHSHLPTTRGRRGHTAGGHELIYKSRGRGCSTLTLT